MNTILVDPMETLAVNLRAAGVPVVKIEVEEGWVKGGEPDATAKENGRLRSFYAPHFHWRMENGNKFRGKPPVYLNRQRVVKKLLGVTLLVYEVVSEDRERMMRDAVTMIRKSAFIPAGETLPAEGLAVSPEETSE